MAINGIEMITDRSQYDVDVVKLLFKKGIPKMTDSEKESFLLCLKGAYNYTDFNRVESAVEYLFDFVYTSLDEIKSKADELGVYWNELFDVPYNPKDYEYVDVKTDWNISDILTEKQRERYLNNIIYILGSLNHDSSLIPKKMAGMTYDDANNIERSLENLNYSLTSLKDEKEKLIENASKSWYFSGDLICGEV